MPHCFYFAHSPVCSFEVSFAGTAIFEGRKDYIQFVRLKGEHVLIGYDGCVDGRRSRL